MNICFISMTILNVFHQYETAGKRKVALDHKLSTKHESFFTGVFGAISEQTLMSQICHIN